MVSQQTERLPPEWEKIPGGYAFPKWEGNWVYDLGRKEFSENSFMSQQREKEDECHPDTCRITWTGTTQSNLSQSVREEPFVPLINFGGRLYWNMACCPVHLLWFPFYVGSECADSRRGKSDKLPWVANHRTLGFTEFTQLLPPKQAGSFLAPNPPVYGNT